MRAFQDRVLNAPDVCSSCFARVRRARHKTTSATLRSDVTAEKSKYTRVDQTTEIDHSFDGTPTNCIVVWCDCGAESAFDRWWKDGDDRCLTLDRFEEMVVRCYYTLESKGLNVNRETFVKYSLHYYKTDHDVNDALGAALSAGLRPSSTGGGSGKNRAAASD